MRWRGREFKRGRELKGTARRRGRELKGTARRRGRELKGTARRRGRELKGTARRATPPSHPQSNTLRATPPEQHPQSNTLNVRGGGNLTKHHLTKLGPVGAITCSLSGVDFIANIVCLF